MPQDKHFLGNKKSKTIIHLIIIFVILLKTRLTDKIEPMIKKIIFNSGYQLIGKSFSLIVSILITALLTRSLGATGYGQYILIFSLINLAITLANWGSHIIGVRELAKSKNQAEVFGSLLLLKITFALAISLIGFILILTLPIFSTIRLESVLGLIIILAAILELTFESVFQAHIKMGIKTVLNIIYSLIFLIITFLLIQNGFGLISPFIGSIFGKIISNLLGFVKTKQLIRGKIKINYQIIGRLAKESAPMGALLVLFAAYDQTIDSLIIKNYLGADQVGYYGLAYRIYANLVLPAYFINNSIFPIISKSPKKNLVKLTRAGYLFSFLILLIIVPASFIFSQPIINFIAGKNFQASVLPLKILSLSLMFSYVNHLNGFSLIALGHQKDSLKIGVFALIWNLVFNLIFIPKAGIIAAAIITLSTEALTTVASSIVLKNRKASLF